MKAKMAPAGSRVGRRKGICVIFRLSCLREHPLMHTTLYTGNGTLEREVRGYDNQPTTPATARIVIVQFAKQLSNRGCRLVECERSTFGHQLGITERTSPCPSLHLSLSTLRKWNWPEYSFPLVSKFMNEFCDQLGKLLKGMAIDVDIPRWNDKLPSF